LEDQIDNVIMVNRKRFGIYPSKEIIVQNK
jgi:hypothetical protein